MSTYSSAQGDQWTIEANSRENNATAAAAASAGPSSFCELTKDLMGGNDLESADENMERLDFDMENDIGEDKTNLETQPPFGFLSDSESGDESVAMKEGKDNDAIDKTVGVSVQNHKEDDVVDDDDDDKTIAFSEAGDEDDQTIAMSIANHSTEDVELKHRQHQQHQQGQQPANAIELNNTTIDVSTSKGIEDDELSQAPLLDKRKEDKPKTSYQSSGITNANKSDDDDDDDEEEMEFDMPAVDSTEPSEVDKNENDTDDTNQEDAGEDATPKDSSSRFEEYSSLETATANPTTPRRSVRARKPRVLYSEERQESVLSKSGAKKQKKKKKSPKTKPANSDAPTEEDWIAATDRLYLNTKDKSVVTVKEFILELQDKFGCQHINKSLKKAVRNRLKDIVNGNVVPEFPSDDDEHGEESQAHSQANEQELEDSESEEEADDEASDYEDDEEAQKNRPRKKIEKKKTTTAVARPKQRKSRSTAKAASKVMEAHRLRQKKRAEELRVRNEEMQLDQTKEDEERQELIAAKFETNTDELRLKRLEERLDLLQRLDETRISVVVNQRSEETRISVVVGHGTKPPKEERDSKEDDDDDDSESRSSKSECESEEESSSDEEELDIVGMKKPIRPLKPLQNHLPSRGLKLLETIGSPTTRKKARAILQRTKSNKKNDTLSPNKSMGARFKLRQVLKQKQRSQGNRWLARELGYKTEEDHLQDCRVQQEQKRGLVVKLERERLKANERKQLRERLLLQEQQSAQDDEYDDNDPSDEAYVPPAEEEEDEEMKLAKEIEQEANETARAKDDGKEEEKDTENESPEISEKVAVDKATVEKSFGLLEPQPLVAGTIVDELEKQEKLPSPSKVDTNSEEENSPSGDKKEEDLSALDDSPLTTTTNPESGTTEDNAIATTDTPLPNALDESVVTPEKNDSRSDDEGEVEFEDINEEETSNRPRNAGWQAMLEREAEKLKKRKKQKGGLVEEEAEEEEEEEIAGLEDFGFSISKKNKKNDDEDHVNDQLDEEDLKHVVDDVSDGEGDEDAGRIARKRLEQQEEKARHKEILRRMREGYDGRRGGIAGGGAGARGMHRFDQLVAADNREDAKRLGLLNDDELDSEDEDGRVNKNANDEEEDETALLDKMLKDRFLHRSSVDLEENFSEDEEEEEEEVMNSKSVQNLIDERKIFFEYWISYV